MPRTLCLDFGEKRIGVALSDPLNWTAQPLPFIPNDKNTFAAIQKLVGDFDVVTVVLGLPKKLDGGESKKSEEVRAFADRLGLLVSAQIIFRDERFSTSAAQKHLIAAGLRREKRKEVIDSQAAVFVLQGYLDGLQSNRR